VANDEQLRILKQGVAVWNQWREGNLEVRIGLRGADLSGAGLSGADLSGANLSTANLNKSDLQSARLRSAKLDAASATDIKLWDVQRAGWSIKGISCERAYWDQKNEEVSTYRPGEFEKLFAE
jgi:uncharacterized protein YjbI with pentapeptide repeats